MNKIILKNKLLATTAICAISVCANTVKAEEISILDILNNSNTKSPNISWEKVTSAGENTIQIGDGYYKYIWTNNDTTRGKYTEHQSSLSGNVKADFIGVSSSSNGGAIYNRGTISSITGDFIGNSVTATNSTAEGGAIYNNGTIESITGDFTGNSATSTDGFAYGGAIYNYYYATIESITGDFIGNSAASTDGFAYGGAIYNKGTIESITGDFIGNSATSAGEYSYAYGGAIFNDETITSITGDFIGNSVTSTGEYSAAWGGAIYNNDYAAIESITGDFTGNSATGSSYAYGGAIYNNGTIESITGDFTGNSATSTDGFASGGAIDNGYGTISSITGDFIGNSATATDGNASGGAIINNGTISSITGDFIGNSATSKYASGGAILNYGTISSITGDFEGNSATSTNGNAFGGAIFNYGTISSITGDFEGNSASSGGAIFNDETITSITGDFIGNSVTSTGEYSAAYGGAIYNNGTIESITGDFTGNSATSTDGFAYGGAIYNYATIESITGDFIGNSVTSTGEYSAAHGGAISNEGTISSITGDFIGNSATGTYTNGGAIYNSNTISSITGDFIGNSATGTSYTYGGAVYNSGTIESITGDFTNNSATSTSGSAYGGAIYNYGKSMLQTVVQDWYGYENFEEYAQYMRGYSSGEELLAKLGVSSEEEITPEIVMYMNYGVFSAREFANKRGYDSVEEMLDAYGYSSLQEMANNWGYYDKGITFVADASDSEDTLQDDILIKGNYIEIDGDKRYEAIYNEGTINITSNNGGSYTFYDYIDGNNGTLNFVSDDHKGATINLYNNIQNQANINFQNKYVLNMISPDDIHQDVFTSKYSYIQAKNININAALQMMLDVDLENAEMDRFEADNFTIADGGSINVVQLNIVKDLTVRPTEKIEVPFIVIDDISKATGLDKISTNITEVIGTNYTYSVTFNPDTGAFEFYIPSTPAPEEVAPNQAPVVTATTTVATVETVVAQIFDRDVTISTDINYGADTTDYMETSDGVNIHNNKSVWVKTFGSDDDVKVENFSNTIDAEAYGIVGGVDSKVFTYDNGVKAAYGVYGAYVGGKQKYNDSKIEQKSGYLGVSASFRKSNLFSNFTLNGGYITSEANTAWGKDKFDTKVVSVANKTGVDIKTYNNWKITPALYVAYTGMDTEDYTNKAGVKMENEFSNVITIAPELKVSNRIGKDLDGYAKVSYKHYIYDAEVRADDVLLEEMSAKPYVEYGFGVEKNWADKSGYFELTRRSGGREGWNVNLGLNFDF